MVHLVYSIMLCLVIGSHSIISNPHKWCTLDLVHWDFFVLVEKNKIGELSLMNKVICFQNSVHSRTLLLFCPTQYTMLYI